MLRTGAFALPEPCVKEFDIVPAAQNGEKYKQ